MLAFYHAYLTFGTSQTTVFILLRMVSWRSTSAWLVCLPTGCCCQAHSCSPEVQGSNSAVCLAAFFKGLELHNVTFPADKAVIDFNRFFVSNKLESSLACFLPKPSTVSQTILFTVWELRVLLELFPVDGFHAAALFSTVRVYWSWAQWS